MIRHPLFLSRLSHILHLMAAEAVTLIHPYSADEMWSEGFVPDCFVVEYDYYLNPTYFHCTLGARAIG